MSSPGPAPERPANAAGVGTRLAAAVARLDRLAASRLEQALPLLLAVVAACFAAAFVACATARATFGFELSWMESGMQAMTDRVGSNQSIYVEPSAAYVPFIYPPLYYFVAHAVDRALPGSGPFTPMRLVSILATVATAGTVVVVLRGRRSLGSRRALLLGALFLAFYGRFLFWYDTSRVDSLFVWLMFTATALLVEGRRPASAVAAGVICGLAIVTKQPAVPLFLVAVAVVAITERRWKRAALAMTVAIGTTLAVLALLGELFNPWLYYYLLRVPATHRILPRTLVTSVIFFVTALPLLGLFAATQLRHAIRERQASSGFTAWPWIFVGWTAVVFVLRLKQGTSVNFFIPLIPAGILAAAPVLEQLGRRGEWLLLAQYLALAYNPLRAIPTAADWRAEFDLLETLRQIPGPIFLPQFPGYLSMLGKPPVAHGVAVCDLFATRPQLVPSIRAQVDGGSFAAAVPWPAEAPGDEICHLQSFARPSRTMASIPAGGDFFAQSHRSKLGPIQLFGPAAMVQTQAAGGRDEERPGTAGTWPALPQR